MLSNTKSKMVNRILQCHRWRLAASGPGRFVAIELDADVERLAKSLTIWPPIDLEWSSNYVALACASG